MIKTYKINLRRYRLQELILANKHKPLKITWSKASEIILDTASSIPVEELLVSNASEQIRDALDKQLIEQIADLYMTKNEVTEYFN